jgi:hypothetical protein
MVSRVLNIYIIKQRAKRKEPEPAPRPQPPPPRPRSPDGRPRGGSHHHHNGHYYQEQKGRTSVSAVPVENKLTEYYIDVGHGRCVRLRGLADDLQAITATSWLRAKTHVEGYLEATATLIVYMVAALSGNITQAGSIVLMALLLVTSGLLALSNAHVNRFSVNGRVAQPTLPDPSTDKEEGGDREINRVRHEDSYPDTESSWPSETTSTASTCSTQLGRVNDWGQGHKGPVGQIVRDPYPFQDGVNYN